MKPENVIVSDGVFKLCDYGMAKIIEEDDNPYSKRDFTQIGSPIYKSPQLWKGVPYSAKADIWAVGVSFYQLLYN